MSERNFEEEARQQGWLSEEEYKESKGHLNGWSDAETFVKRGEEILPIVNAKNKELKGELESLRSQLDEMKSVKEEFKEFSESQRKKDKERIDQLEEQLKATRAKAVADGDSKAFAEADEQLQEIRDHRSSKSEESDAHEVRARIQKEIDNWKNENSWYETDVNKTAALDGAANTLIREKPELQGTGVKLFQEALKKAEEMFPEFFKEGSGQKVESGGQRHRGSSKAKTYDNLPDEAKAACQRFVKQGFMTQEQYVAEYDWE